MFVAHADIFCYSYIMSVDIYRDRFPENSVATNHKIAIAESLAHEYEEKKPRIIAEANDAMIASGNEVLLRNLNEFGEMFENYFGAAEAREIRHGISFAFLYFKKVAEEVDKSPLAVVTDEKIDIVNIVGIQRHNSAYRDSEFNVGEALGDVQRQRVQEDYREIDLPLLFSTSSILGLYAQRNVPPKQILGFLDGVAIMNQLFRQPASEPLAAD